MARFISLQHASSLDGAEKNSVVSKQCLRPILSLHRCLGDSLPIPKHLSFFVLSRTFLFFLIFFHKTEFVRYWVQTRFGLNCRDLHAYRGVLAVRPPDPPESVAQAAAVLGQRVLLCHVGQGSQGIRGGKEAGDRADSAEVYSTV